MGRVLHAHADKQQRGQRTRAAAQVFAEHQQQQVAHLQDILGFDWIYYVVCCIFYVAERARLLTLHLLLLYQ